MKITIEQYHQFWDYLGDDWYVDDTNIPDDLPPPGTVMDVQGVLCWHGDGEPCNTKGREVFSKTELNDGVAIFTTVFKRWLKLQETCVLIVRCDRVRAEALREIIQSAGGKVENKWL